MAESNDIVVATEPKDESSDSSMSLDSFNHTLLAFVDQLLVLFARNKLIVPKLKTVHSAITVMVNNKATRRKPLEMFVAAVKPHMQMIRDRDDALFGEPLATIPFLSDIDGLGNLWNNGKICSENKDAIWMFLNMLSMIGITITSLNPELMSAVENIAQMVVQGGDDGMSALTGMLGAGGGGGGLNPSALMGMLSSLGGGSK